MHITYIYRVWASKRACTCTWNCKNDLEIALNADDCTNRHCWNYILPLCNYVRYIKVNTPELIQNFIISNMYKSHEVVLNFNYLFIFVNFFTCAFSFFLSLFPSFSFDFVFRLHCLLYSFNCSINMPLYICTIFVRNFAPVPFFLQLRLFVLCFNIYKWNRNIGLLHSMCNVS